jgi:hypothetical protein
MLQLSKKFSCPTLPLVSIHSRKGYSNSSQGKPPKHNFKWLRPLFGRCLAVYKMPGPYPETRTSALTLAPDPRIAFTMNFDALVAVCNLCSLVECALTHTLGRTGMSTSTSRVPYFNTLAASFTNLVNCCRKSRARRRRSGRGLQPQNERKEIKVQG